MALMKNSAQDSGIILAAFLEPMMLQGQAGQCRRGAIKIDI
jgi:hypothetical protein